MCDIFKQKDIIAKLKGKSFLFLGDSIMRNLYKDLVWLTTSPYENFIPTRWMARKGEKHMGNIREEVLTHGGPDMYEPGRLYQEERDFYLKDHDLQFSFAFITRCWSDRLGHWLQDYPNHYGSYPDVIMINSVSIS